MSGKEQLPKRQRRIGYGVRIRVPEVPAEIPLPSEVPADNYTKIHHSIEEYWMRRLSGNGYKIFSWVLRRIVGWVDHETGQPSQHEVAITLDEFAEYTGITNRDVLLGAILECIIQGAIEAVQRRGANNTKFYCLRQQRGSYEYVTAEKRPSKKRKSTSVFTDAQLPVGANMELPVVTDAQQAVVTDVPRQKAPQDGYQDRQKAASGNSERGAKETAKESRETKQERKLPSSASLRTGAPHVAPPDEKQKAQEKKTRGDTQTLRSPSSLPAHTMRAKETPRAAEGIASPSAELAKEANDSASRWWNRVKEDMQAMVTPATWASWFPATRGLRLEGRTLVVYVPKAAQEQMEHRWAALIAAILERAARPGLHVRYTQEET